MSTFEQSLDLVARGQEQEALAGCEFILGLDPLFQPARRLQERLKSPARPVRVDDLRPGAADAPLELDPLGLDDLEPLDLGDAGNFAPAAPARPTGGLGAVLHDLLSRQNYQQVLQIADTQREAIERDPQLRAMVEQARAATAAPAAAPAAGGVLALGGAEDDFLALQRQSLRIDPADGPDDGLSGLGGNLDELEALDLDEEELPDLDSDLSLTDEPIGLAASREQALGDELELDAGGDEIDEGSRERIHQLLAEGQEIYERGDYQGAIDVWSRIFLIDVSNGEASARIDDARRQKAELERQAEETFHGACGQIERGDTAGAMATLQQVLSLDPAHALAREYLDQLQEGGVPVVSARAGVGDDAFGGFGDTATPVAAADAPASIEAAVRRDRVVVVKKTDKKLIALGALVAILVVGGGAYLFLNKDKLFPNTQAPAAAAVPPRIDPIARATQMQERGETEQAIALLREIGADDPAHDQAVALIAQWEALISAAAAKETAPPPELLARRTQLINAAHQARGVGTYLRARKYFERANKILPLAGEDLVLMKNCDVELQDLAHEIELFQAREYTQVIPDLWRKREKNPSDPDINLLIVDSYYNLALADLQRGDAQNASEKLKDVLEIAPGDDDLRRLHLFAKTYATREKDLLYKIFIKYLPTRS